MTLTQAQQEALYDAQRSGAAYVKAQPAGAAAVWDQILDIIADDDDDGSEDTPIADVEARIQDIDYPRLSERARGIEAGRALVPLLQQGDATAIAAWADQHLSAPEDTDTIASVLEACDGGDRTLLDERFDAIIDRVAELPDNQRAQAISLWEGFVAGVGAA